MVPYSPLRFGSIFLVVALATTISLCAQETPQLGPLEPSDTSSPTATLTSLIDSCNELQELINSNAVAEGREGEFLPVGERILDCLDLSEFPKELRLTAGIEAALFLKEVLDRIEFPTAAEIPNASEPPSEGPALLRWQIPRTRLAIAKIEAGPDQNAWLFTPDTVRNAAQYYRIVKDLPYRTDGPAVSPGLYDAYVAATYKRPTLTADTSSPRGTMTLFLDTCNELHDLVEKDRYLNRNSPDFQRLGQKIISCLDTSQLADAEREYVDAEAAVCLKEVLDRIPLPPAEQIPGIESVESADGSEATIRWQVPQTQIVISKMTEGPRRGEFLFSAGTVARAPELYSKTIDQPYRTDGRPVSEGLYSWWLSRPGNPAVAMWVDSLPPWFQERRMGLAFWQWIGLLITASLAMLLMVIALRMGYSRREPVHGERGSVLRHWLGLVSTLVAVVVPLIFKYVVWEYLTLRGQPLYIANFVADVVFLLAVMVLIVRTSSRVAETIIALPSIAPRGLDANLIRIVSQLLGITAAVIVFLEGGRYLGFPLTTLIASAGIGGLAIALSAQGVIKGLFGTVMILLDKPYRVGQRITVGEHDGVVEDIGLRSTKLRALDNRMIAIPNDQMADSRIENIGDFDRIKRKTEILIPQDTPCSQVEEALKCIREVLDDHEGMVPEFPPLVYFTEFGTDAFKIMMMYWYSPADMKKFFEFAEQINLEIMRLFEDKGIQFSLPFRHTFWKHDDQQGPLDIMIQDHQQADPS